MARPGSPSADHRNPYELFTRKINALSKADELVRVVGFDLSTQRQSGTASRPNGLTAGFENTLDRKGNCRIVDAGGHSPFPDQA
jgi:hypothetical protein